MEQFHFSNLAEAASFARRGSNSAVLKRLEYGSSGIVMQIINLK